MMAKTLKKALVFTFVLLFIGVSGASGIHSTNDSQYVKGSGPGNCIAIQNTNQGSENLITKSIPFVGNWNAFIVGRIVNLASAGNDTLTFNAVNVRIIAFHPFLVTSYMSGEQVIILDDWRGLLLYHFISARCNIQL